MASTCLPEPKYLSHTAHSMLCSLVWPDTGNEGELANVQAPWFQGFEFCQANQLESFFVQHRNGSVPWSCAQEFLLPHYILCKSLCPINKAELY